MRVFDGIQSLSESDLARLVVDLNSGVEIRTALMNRGISEERSYVAYGIEQSTYFLLSAGVSSTVRNAVETSIKKAAKAGHESFAAECRSRFGIKLGTTERRL